MTNRQGEKSRRVKSHQQASVKLLARRFLLRSAQVCWSSGHQTQEAGRTSSRFQNAALTRGSTEQTCGHHYDQLTSHG